MRTSELLPLLADLAVLVEVVEAGSFSAAARLQGSTPSAVSRQIARLEAALGLKLLERSTRRLRLSSGGQEVLRHARAMLEAARAACDGAAHHASSVSGRVRLAAPKAALRQLIHPQLPGLLQLYPQLSLELQVTDQVVDLIADGVDIALRLGDPPPGYVARPFMEVRTLLYAAPAYLAANGTPQHPAELVRHSCLQLAELPGDDEWCLMRDNERVVVNVRGRYASNHSEMRREAAEWGLGIACLPDFSVRQQLADGSLQQVLPGWQLLGRYQGSCWLVYHADRYRSPRVRAVVDYLLQIAADLGQQRA
ncbi:LysR family transcriptional regulator [Vogesella sp. LIG4]|uniref:LysR family transcriptional regulator n=1 Tax=Vogesella sp. LIG4 TaxID=1192162 RepID=UPI000820100C|nr:LysR family transcriptional regulator [Vogesella sp. LIG4]SCK15878.1 DNA-binding transcriptional regulator, LysR family [Vogesella sp. LIG4]